MNRAYRLLATKPGVVDLDDFIINYSNVYSKVLPVPSAKNQSVDDAFLRWVNDFIPTISYAICVKSPLPREFSKSTPSGPIVILVFVKWDNQILQ